MSIHEELLARLRDDLDGALLSSAIWSDPNTPLASFEPPPDALRRFDRFTDQLRTLLKQTGFPPLGGYYLLALEQDRMVAVLSVGEVRWGLMVDTTKSTLGVLLSVAIPNALAGLERAGRAPQPGAAAE